MLKKVLLYTVVIFLSCNTSDSKFIRREIKKGDLKIVWFYKSYISNVSRDIVLVKKGELQNEIFSATMLILNVTLENDTIFIKTIKPSRMHALESKNLDSVFGYKVILDSTGMPEELNLIPDGVKE